MDFEKLIEFLSPKGLKDWCQRLLNDNESLHQENKSNEKRIKELEDEVRLLKGEKVKPDFKKPKDRSSSKEFSEPKNRKRKKRRQKEDLVIDKTKRIRLDKKKLPAGSVHKGYRRVTIQEIIFKRHNIVFELERFISPDGTITEAKIPTEYKSFEFGPELRSFIVNQYFGSDSTHGKIKKLLAEIGISISTSQINNIILGSSKEFKSDVLELRETSLEKLPYQHIDDTSWKVIGSPSCSTTVTGNPYFTLFTTEPSYARSVAIKSLSGWKEPLYLFNKDAINIICKFKSAKNIEMLIRKNFSYIPYSEAELKSIFEKEEFDKLSFYTLRDIKTGTYQAALINGNLGVTGSCLVSDGARKYQGLLANHVLCWVHEIRHYKLIESRYLENREKLKSKLKEIYNLYWMIKRAREDITEAKIEAYNKKFQKCLYGGSNRL